MILFLGVGAGVGRAMGGGAGSYRGSGILHGLGLLLILVSGFGLMAKLGIPMTMGFFHVKLLLWLLLGASFALVRKPRFSQPLLLALPLLGGIAAYMGIFKPF